MYVLFIWTFQTNVSKLHYQRALLFHRLKVLPLVKTDYWRKIVNKISFQRSVPPGVNEFWALPDAILCPMASNVISTLVSWSI